MIYVTGDLHGDIGQLQSSAVRKLKRGDTLIVCGDFGFLWEDSRAERKRLVWLGKRRYHLLFVEGTHDNLDLLREYPTEPWNGGLTRPISGRLRQLVRGELFELEGKRILAMGGGQPDEGAQLGVNCWQGALPDKDEILAICDRLDSCGWQLDAIISHQAPTNIDACITHRVCEVNFLTALMDTIQRKSKFGDWCFGSYHQNRLVPPNYRCLYNQVYCLGGVPQGLLAEGKRKKAERKGEG
ncbi:MAG: hypothetical protein RR022_03670 [Angelakisella sp.]